jgi:hypothetical protein
MLYLTRRAFPLGFTFPGPRPAIWISCLQVLYRHASLRPLHRMPTLNDRDLSGGPGGAAGRPRDSSPRACGGCCPCSTSGRSCSTGSGLPPDVQSASLGLYDSATNPAACTTASGRAACTTTARAACSGAGRAGSCTSTYATGLLDGHPVTDWHSSSGPTLRLLRHPLRRLASTGELLERLGRPTVEGCHG